MTHFFGSNALRLVDKTNRSLDNHRTSMEAMIMIMSVAVVTTAQQLADPTVVGTVRHAGSGRLGHP